VLFAMLMLSLVGCGDPEPSPAGESHTPVQRQTVELEPSNKVGAADFDGDGVDEWVRFLDGFAFWGDHTVELGGEVQVVHRGDPDGEGHAVLLVGTCMVRANRAAKTRIWSLGERGPEILFERDVERNQVADLDFVGERLWVALYGPGKTVEAGWLDGRKFDVVERRNLAIAWLPLGDETRVVGRVYGDAPKAPGDLRLIGPEGERVLPTLRGVRALAAADLDGDGVQELLVGDGWHYAYGRQALARVRLLEGPDWSTGRTIAMFDGEYTVWSIEVVGQNILATGSKGVHLLSRDALGWADHLVAPVAETGNAVVFKDDKGLWALVAGKPSVLVPLD
jgi:hypothetical protein